MDENKIDEKRGNDMKTLIRIEKTANGWAHWFRIGNLVVIEFVGGN